jgi:hypothetical protein
MKKILLLILLTINFVCYAETASNKTAFVCKGDEFLYDLQGNFKEKVENSTRVFYIDKKTKTISTDSIWKAIKAPLEIHEDSYSGSMLTTSLELKQGKVISWSMNINRFTGESSLVGHYEMPNTLSTTVAFQLFHGFTCKDNQRLF